MPGQTNAQVDHGPIVALGMHDANPVPYLLPLAHSAYARINSFAAEISDGPETRGLARGSDVGTVTATLDQ